MGAVLRGTARPEPAAGEGAQRHCRRVGLPGGPAGRHSRRPSRRSHGPARDQLRHRQHHRPVDHEQHARHVTYDRAHADGSADGRRRMPPHRPRAPHRFGRSGAREVNGNCTGPRFQGAGRDAPGQTAFLRNDRSQLPGRHQRGHPNPGPVLRHRRAGTNDGKVFQQAWRQSCISGPVACRFGLKFASPLHHSKGSDMSHAFNPSRRRLLHTDAGAAAAFALPASVLAQSRQIVVAEPGGPYSGAYRKAFFDPFEKATGIRVVSVVREAQPVAQFTAMVETKNYIWDVTTLALGSDIPILEARGLLEPIGLKAAEFPGMMPGSVRENWLGVDVYSTVIGYRSDKFGTNRPQNWADFWDVKKFPGRRGMRSNPLDTLEEALMADGVPIDKLYPLDVDRAFRSLDKIKPQVAWWTSGAQSAQLIQSGEVDMICAWNGR